jgi:hypothetical protein
MSPTAILDMEEERKITKPVPEIKHEWQIHGINFVNIVCSNL